MANRWSSGGAAEERHGVSRFATPGDDPGSHRGTRSGVMPNSSRVQLTKTIVYSICKSRARTEWRRNAELESRQAYGTTFVMGGFPKSPHPSRPQVGITPRRDARALLVTDLPAALWRRRSQESIRHYTGADHTHRFCDYHWESEAGVACISSAAPPLL